MNEEARMGFIVLRVRPTPTRMCVYVMNIEQASISSLGVCDIQRPKSVVLYSPMSGHGTRENTCPALDAMQEKRNFAFWVIGVGSIALKERLKTKFLLPRLHAHSVPVVIFILEAAG